MRRRFVLLALALTTACADTEPAPDGPVEWTLDALASEGNCTTDDECVVYRHDCLVDGIREHGSCAISVPADFDTAELDAVMQTIADTGVSPFEGGCGMCTLELPPDPVCLEGECTFPPRG
ncbi:MAG: hypothetical protein H6722_05245 [Sandaracinus sp.]|nr:hypothetical protein [Sandaracinus sp.]MCB9611845.1 hypothetical protein [Sandaracinus sp.]MCB9619616.1 hypothetical protein [Sandaracinus sp.]MCB9624542.1 hypothetical protein [Sandaracinus sp.]